MLKTAGPWFKDEYGRTLILRGVNLGGSSKVPYPNGATHIREGFFDHRTVSFVGRPFPLAEADEHFARLKAWGFTFLRFLVTWEAIEHAGPGQYDQEYLDYLYAVVRKAGEHGLRLFIDPHQDVWSRFTGGDGAPGWTLEAVGLELTRLAATGAALIHALHGDPFPWLIWPTNDGKLAAATMFTLFFGGHDFAPQMRIDGEPVQEYLQRHYIAALQQVARRLRGLPAVVGYDTLNEPSCGYIGSPDLDHQAQVMLRLGEAPTPLQAMALGAGIPQQVACYGVGLAGERVTGHRWLNQERVRAWREGYDCIWRQHGVWDVDAAGAPRALRPDHFAQVDGRPVDFDRDYFRPFANRYARAIREVEPDALIFVETVPGDRGLTWGPEDAPAIVHAAHQYDGFPLFTRRFIPWFTLDARTRRFVLGVRRAQAVLNDQMADYVRVSAERMGNVPTLIGEFGIPMVLNGARAYRTGDFSAQEAALDRSFQALEANLLSGTLWNYTADNDNVRGDQWNGEDFSLFSRDQQRDPADLNAGGRALAGAVRPYPRAVAGEPLRFGFDRRRRCFELEFRHDPAVGAPTELFVPNLQYPQGYQVTVSDGTFAVDRAAQQVTYRHDLARPVHWVRIAP